ncbi:MAG: hypothetical protein HQ567_10620, partial [Candidatus Nealsonbacteria bacterium]|nr:hypothetical protein [Candidatus Nealsonbacteria bacterium]
MWFAMPASALVITDFDGDTLDPNVSLDVPDALLGDITLDTDNDELDFDAFGGTDMWFVRNNAPIAWTSPPTVSNGQTWSIETEVRLNSIVENGQVAGITFYGGPDGAKPDFGFGLDNWNPATRMVKLQGLGDNIPDSHVAWEGSSAFLRVEVTENGDTDTYNFLYKADVADNWTRLLGAGLDFQSDFDNSRAGLFYKTNGAKEGAAFTYLNAPAELLPEDLTWDGGAAPWGEVAAGTSHWTGGAPEAVPNSETEAVIDSGTATVEAIHAARSLTVGGGGLAIDPGQSLTVGWDATFAADTTLAVGAGATLDVDGVLTVATGVTVPLGADAVLAVDRGSIGGLTTAGNATLDVGDTLTVARLTDSSAGTLTKLGGGILTLDNQSGTDVSAAQTTFRIEAGTLEASGTDPLGGAASVVLAGGTLAVDLPHTAWDFESGDMTGWNIVDTLHGDNAVFTTAGNMPTAAPATGFNNATVQGNFFVRTWEGEVLGNGDGPTGIVETDSFVLAEGAQFDLLVGGCNHPFGGDPDSPDANMTAVNLERLVGADDWEMVFSATGPNQNELSAVTWDASAHVGETVRLRIYDTSTVGWGHVDVDNIVLSGAGSVDMLDVDLLLEGSSTVSAAPGASFGVLTINDGTLTTSGGAGISFTETTITPDLGVTEVGFHTEVATDPGQINVDSPVVILKTGQSDMVLTAANVGTGLADATFDVREARLIGVHGPNPFGAAKLQLSGGELVLSSAGGDVTYDNELTVTETSVLTAGAAGGGVADPLTVTLAPPAGLSIPADKELEVRSTDEYTLDVAGSLAGEGEFTVTGGNVTLSGTASTVGTMTVSAGTVSTAGNEVSISDRLILGDTTFSIVGGTFAVSGSDLVSETETRQLTLGGGTFTVTGAADMIAGQSVGIDFADGPNTAGSGIETNFNLITEDTASLPAIDTTGAVTGVTITATGIAGVMGENNLGFGAAGVGDYTGTPFSDLSFNDGVYRNGADGQIDITLSGLNDSLTYDVLTIFGGPMSANSSVSAAVDGTTQDATYSEFRADNVLTPMSFSGVSTDGAGNLLITLDSPSWFGASAVVLTTLIANPEPVQLPNTNLLVTASSIVNLNTDVAFGNLTVQDGVTALDLQGGVYSFQNVAIAGNLTVDGEMTVLAALDVGDGVAAAVTIGENGEVAFGPNATYNVEVSLGDGSAIAADKIIVSGSGGIYLDGTLAPRVAGRSDNSFFSDEPVTIVDNSARGTLEGVAGDTLYEFAAVDPALPGPGEPAPHLGQGAFLRGVNYVKLNPEFPTITESVDLDLFIALGGDADGDGKVWLSDWAALRANFGNTGTGK